MSHSFSPSLGFGQSSLTRIHNTIRSYQVTMEEPRDAVGMVLEPSAVISGGLPPVKPSTKPAGFLCGGELFLTGLCVFLMLVSDCGAVNEIKSKDAIRCRECGYRILYKKRERKCRKITPFCLCALSVFI